MRTYFTPLVAVIALFARSGVASAVSASSPTKLAPLNPGFQTENNSARFLRKIIEDESDDVTNTEERGALTDVVKTAKQYVNGEQRLAKLFKKTDEELYKKNLSPDYLAKAAKKLKRAGWPSEKVDDFDIIAERYSKYWYHNLPDPF